LAARVLELGQETEVAETVDSDPDPSPLRKLCVGAELTRTEPAVQVLEAAPLLDPEVEPGWEP
jgi:hypothetical protein